MTFRDLLEAIGMKHRERFLYNLRTEGDGYIITKHGEDMEVVSLYHMTSDPNYPGIQNAITCNCPQGAKPTCRHRKMFPMMLERVDTGWFFDFDNTGQWFDPFNTEGAAPADMASEEQASTMRDGLERDELLKMGSPPPRDEMKISRRSFK